MLVRSLCRVRCCLPPRLAKLLEDEKAAYEAEIEASFETPEQAKERCVHACCTQGCCIGSRVNRGARRMFARARELQAAREAERQRTVAELEEKRWRLSSDVLRARESKIRLLNTTADREAQLIERERQEAAKVSGCSSRVLLKGLSAPLFPPFSH